MRFKKYVIGFFSIVLTISLLMGCNWKNEPKDPIDQQDENNESDLQRGRQ